MTTEQPAIGSPKWARSLPPSVNTRGELKFDGTQVWTDDKGNVKGQVWLGSVDLTFRTPAQVRDLIGRLAALAGEMDAEIARQREPVDEPHPAIVCSRCGAADVPTILGDDGEPRCYNHPKCAARVAARDAEAAKVTR